MGMPVDKVMEILEDRTGAGVAGMPIGEEEDSHLGDFIPDEGCPSP